MKLAELEHWLHFFLFWQINQWLPYTCTPFWHLKSFVKYLGEIFHRFFSIHSNVISLGLIYVMSLWTYSVILRLEWYAWNPVLALLLRVIRWTSVEHPEFCSSGQGTRDGKGDDLGSLEKQAELVATDKHCICSDNVINRNCLLMTSLTNACSAEINVAMDYVALDIMSSCDIAIWYEF